MTKPSMINEIVTGYMWYKTRGMSIHADLLMRELKLYFKIQKQFEIDIA